MMEFQHWPWAIKFFLNKMTGVLGKIIKVIVEMLKTLKNKFKKPKFKIGDKVRISKYKRKLFDKGFTPNWTEEVFVVDGILHTKPVTYRLVDLQGETVTGSFYEQELQKTTQEIFRIDEVIFRDKKRALVKWKGYPNKFNSWVPLNKLKNLM